ncbi:hypothetical protein Tco_1409280 [Tanacetum coccineum]
MMNPTTMMVDKGNDAKDEDGQCGDAELEKKVDETTNQFIDNVEKHPNKKNLGGERMRDKWGLGWAFTLNLQRSEMPIVSKLPRTNRR